MSPVGCRTIQRIAWFVLSTLIHWIVIFLLDSVIQPLNNWGQLYTVAGLGEGARGPPYFG